MRVGILGPLTVDGDDGPVDVGGARLRALLIRLAIDVGRTVDSERLAAALWGDRPPADQANALQSLVSRLRRVLPERDVIVSVPTGYRLALPASHVDVTTFEQLARDGRNALDATDAEAAAKLLRRALDLWRGDALADVADAPFAMVAATRLEEIRLAALEDRIEADLALGRHQNVVSELEALAAEHPLRERMRGLQMRALYAAGRQAAALSAYDETRRQLADQLGVDPSPALQQVHLAVLRADPDLHAIPTQPAARSNLRTALTSFVGRENDLARIGELLERSRLVTLVGPGGAGKTRLANEAASALMQRPANGPVFDDGVWLVELAPVTDPADIAQAVLGSLTLREKRLLDNRTPATPHDAMSRLVDAFSTGSALLLLDNCEHLIEGAAQLADHLLSRCPDLRVLATSREPLGIFGEALCPVTSLGLPVPHATAEEALTYPAVQLLVDRGSAVDPDFLLDADTVEAVIEICRRLDGLPLAIELAAARLRSMTVRQVADRLGDRFRLLTGGSRTAVARHQTLRAVVAWSWDLLTVEERHLAERVAVFAGGATQRSAEDVCAGSDLPADEVLDLLTALADKSLVQIVDGLDIRYRMLETIREYGVERLADRDEITRIRAAHAAHFLALAETAEPFLRGAQQIDWIDRLSAERDNLHAALRFAADVGDADTALRLAAALSWYWTLQGSHAEASAWLGLALSVPGPANPQARAVVLVIHGISAFAAGHSEMTMEKARRLVEDELSYVDELGGHPMLAMIGPGAAMLGEDTAGALTAIERNLAHPDPWARAVLVFMRAAIAENDGDVDTLRRDSQDSYERFAQIGDRWGMAITLSGLGGVLMMDGDLSGAIAAFEKSMAMLAELRAGDDVSEQLMRLAMARARSGDMPGARRDVTLALEKAEERRSPLMMSFARFGFGELDRLEGDLVGARRHFMEALEGLDRSPHGPRQMEAIMHAGLAHLDVAEADFDTAQDQLHTALELAIASRDMPIVAIVGVGFAELALACGDGARAALLLGASTSLRGAEDRSNTDAITIATTARTALGPADYDDAYARGLSLSRVEALSLLGERSGYALRQ
jgi:predicted ATPase/DNA-binding SARP family transcriptional activator